MTGPQQRDGTLVVARFTDGRLLKGTTRDFAPNKPMFHLFPWGDEGSESLAVPIGALKAVFFVKSFKGNKYYVKRNDFDGAKGQGRKVLVTFKDGEILAGFTMGYSPGKPGFFLIPADPRSNNERVYVVNAAVNKVEWVTEASPGATAASG
jgi:hypothetical protein